jgi:type I restriction enzyme, S subunit
MTEWQEVVLGDLCERVTVGHVGKMADEYVEEGVPFLRSQNISPFSINRKGMLYINERFHQRLAKSSLKTGDVVVIRTGYPGTAAVIPPHLDNSNCADLVVITPSDQLNPYMLAAVFNSAWGRSAVSGQLVGSAQQHFNVGSARNLRIRLPGRDEQNKIAAVLCALTDLIENNRERIELLEQMARAVYREWFVRFHFPGHEDATLTDSPLGPIPEGWQALPASDILTINPRLPIDKRVEHPFIAMGDLNESSMTCFSSEARAGNSGSKFQNGDTLFARITPSLENGKTGLVQCLSRDETGRGSTEFIVLRGRLVGPAFTYFLAREDNFRANAIQSMSGASGRQRVRIECFDSFLVAAPPATLVTSPGNSRG